MEKTVLLKTAILAALALLMVACSTKKEDNSKGFDTAQMDTTINPSDDFYEYAVGAWVKNTPIPPQYESWSAFLELRDKTDKDIKNIILEASKKENIKEGSNIQKVGTLYKVGMDTAKIEEAGLEPVLPEFERIDNIKNKKDLIKEIAHMHIYTCSPFFYFFASQDEKNSEMMIGKIWQGGVGLPDRDYYLSSNSRSKEIRGKYIKHLENMFKLFGEDETTAKANSETIMKIETELAKNSRTRTENRDVQKTYNKLTVKELKKIAPSFMWEKYFISIGLKNPGSIIVAQPEFLKAASKLIEELPLKNWQTYLKWNLLRGVSSFVNSAFVDERFNFTGKFLKGQKVIKPRWQRVVSTVNGTLGEAVGELYVEKFFPPEAKQRAKKIVDNLLSAVKKRIEQLDWMGEQTKEKALVKLNGFGIKIGYPDKWLDYSKLEIKEDSYIQNIMRASKFSHDKKISEINKPVDRKKWWMYPQTVNAGYSPNMNDITFPAAILQFPFYDKDLDDAINYGAMGAVIGHEITHGFDDQGAQYDVNGNLNNWWTEDDYKKFKAKGAALADQFDKFAPFDSFHVNGKMTLGENIADLGGLTVAFEAFKNTEQYKNNKKIDGFTPAQRFFLAWAQVWKNNIRNEALKLQLKVDVHSPGKYRVNGPLSNMEDFIKAFNIKEGSPMGHKKEEQVKIW